MRPAVRRKGDGIWPCGIKQWAVNCDAGEWGRTVAAFGTGGSKTENGNRKSGPRNTRNTRKNRKGREGETERRREGETERGREFFNHERHETHERRRSRPRNTRNTRKGGREVGTGEIARGACQACAGFSRSGRGAIHRNRGDLGCDGTGAKESPAAGPGAVWKRCVLTDSLDGRRYPSVKGGER